MKFVPALLLNLLVVGGGIVLYDGLKAEPEAAGPLPLKGDSSAGSTSPGGLTGSAPLSAAHSSEARIRAIEAAIAELQAELQRVRNGKGAGDATGDEPTGAVRIDERTLQWMTAYRQEILKREGEARIRDRMALELERKGVNIPADAMESVVRETLAFHARAKALVKKPRLPGMEGRRLRTREIRELRGEYETILLRLVPTDQVELILATRLGRARNILPDDDDAD